MGCERPRLDDSAAHRHGLVLAHLVCQHFDIDCRVTEFVSCFQQARALDRRCAFRLVLLGDPDQPPNFLPALASAEA
jgi:hypothetical protein